LDTSKGHTSTHSRIEGLNSRDRDHIKDGNNRTDTSTGWNISTKTEAHEWCR